ncbi:BrnA antitoxin family protein [Thiothrix nivea]|uniref:BrnA antitoxin family protein n=1 Tax=Thiothrix nivea (strain ATCC 35100 / DSM 5205 / JP2) TaxID=870187 RepID=A0A656H9R8_THINJ|nr:BrnA antitoxin family protein [Thiothrix nivea]EIJ33378.1 hypothetical protein Thini_0741 [Thiothrix nivea DSM 5205]
MKHDNTSKPWGFRPEQIAAAVDAAHDKVEDPDTPYDPNDEAAVNAFWENAEVRMPGQRGKQKKPVKIPVSIRLSAEVVDYFKQDGEGWQTRMEEALQNYIAEHQKAA